MRGQLRCFLLVFVAAAASCTSREQAAAEDEDLGPLDAVLYAGVESKSARADLHTRIEDAVGECMALGGFEYEPTRLDAVEVPVDFGSLSELEQAEEFGFFITIRPPMPAFPESPNDSIVDALSSEEYDAWFLALVGPPASSEAVSFGGCRGQAEAAIVPGRTVAINDWLTLREEMLARLTLDESWVELDAEWSSCMAESGFLYENQAAAVADFRARGAAPLEGDLQGIQEEERDVASKAITCEASLSARRLDIRTRYEEDVLASDRTGLVARLRVSDD